MRPLDWLVVAGYLIWIVADGLRRTKSAGEIDGYLLGNRSLPWWAVGLSVMATQLSAITLVGTTGQAYADGMRFVQFYFGLPIAMVILSMTLVPFFYRSGVYTAYEYLERRFDVKTRTLASFLFLMGRSMSTGAVISAPAVILSIVFHWNLTLTILAIGGPTIIYTMVGGVQAVTWTDVKQMGIVVGGLVCAVAALILGLPHDVSLGQALHVAGAAGRMNTIDFHFDPRQTYTFWSGLIGGLFLHLSYFGCDQSQVQRYLTAKSLNQARHSLLMSAFVKIPLQVLVLMVGVFMFLFYVFNQPPLLFNAEHREAVAKSGRAASTSPLEADFARVYQRRRDAAFAMSAAGTDHEAARNTFAAAGADLQAIRMRASAIVGDVTHAVGYADRTGDTPKPDVNYVFPTFVTTRLPQGLVGLIIAAIFAAAMSATAGELSATATATVMDVYKRLLRPAESDAALPAGVAAGGAVLGAGGLRRRPRRGAAWIADRSGQPDWVDFLRLAAWGLRAGADVPARQRARRIRRPGRRHSHRCRLCISSADAGRVVPVAQPARCRRRTDRRHRRQSDDCAPARFRVTAVAAAYDVFCPALR